MSLYYSPRCAHCNSLVSLIKQRNLTAAIKLMNIDRTQAPQSVQNVPTIVANEKVFVGNAAFEFVNQMGNILAFESGFGGGYSYIDNDDALCENGHNFAFLTSNGFTGFDQHTADAGSSGSNDNLRKKAVEQNGALDRLLEQRKTEIPAAMKRV